MVISVYNFATPIPGSGDDGKDPGGDQPAREEEESSGGSLSLSQHQSWEEDQDWEADSQLNLQRLAVLVAHFKWK